MINYCGFPYTPPVDQLLKLGDVRHPNPRPDYEALDIGKEHIPDLIYMSLDEELNWGDPVCAFSLLTSLSSPAALLWRLLFPLQCG